MRPIVLVAEANELVAAAYRAFLVAEGFEVLRVDNGLDCLARIRERAPQALILDAELPWGSGDGVLEMLAHDPEMPHVPAVLVTVSPSTLARQHSNATVGMTLLKPVAPGKVARTLRELLETGGLVRLK